MGRNPAENERTGERERGRDGDGRRRVEGFSLTGRKTNNLSNPCPYLPSQVPAVPAVLSSASQRDTASTGRRASVLFPAWSHPASQRVSPFHPINLCNSLFIASRCNDSIIRLSGVHSFTAKAAFHLTDIGQISSILVCALTGLSTRSPARTQDDAEASIYSFAPDHLWDALR